jgi:hypothetical protein
MSRDFLIRVCYALLIPAQRVVHGRNTRFKQTVINDVFNLINVLNDSILLWNMNKIFVVLI